MPKELRTIDVSHVPELLRIAEEVGASGEPRVLRKNHVDLAVVMPLAKPARRGRKTRSAADIAAFNSAAGSWDDVDTDRLVKDIYESRLSSRTPIDL